MSFTNVFEKLGKNPPDVLNEAVRILCKIADNIINNPLNLKIRTLQKSNATISGKIISIHGGEDCLKYMGFIENGACYTMSSSVPLSILKDFKNALVSWHNSYKSVVRKIHKQPCDIPPAASSNSKDSTQSDIIKPVVLPPLVHTFNNAFLQQLETISHSVLQYENKELQKRAKSLLPLAVLEESAQNRLRSIQEMIKQKKLKDLELSIQDTLLLDLLSWFKDEFFQWVNSPACEKCTGPSTFYQMAVDKKYLQYTNRVELHKCNSCNYLTPFPRYNDLNILLETRRGRCGEWANTFTLFCRALGWDARYVVEEGDHVWTEVYSIAQRRWIHCDPCENAFDTPLMYEVGWNKKITYVMAYSAEEIQDVTWRYSCKHKEVMGRRRRCTELELVNAILKIRERKMESLSEARRKYLTKRVLFELVELMVEKKPNEGDNKGRTSGSKAWRLARGETRVSPESYTWLINTDNLSDKAVSIKYYNALDKYKCTSGSKILNEIEHWHAGAHTFGRIFRKEEKDWKMVYLATEENENESFISWKFNLRNAKHDLDTVSLYLSHTTFEKGSIKIEVCAGNKQMVLSKGTDKVTFNDIGKTDFITVTATLVGGEYWQHAQLFRQSSDSEEFCFDLSLTFK